MALYNPIVLKTFAAANTIATGTTLGAAVGMYVFSIPIIKEGREYSSLMMTQQFHELISRGTRYLQGGSRIQGACLAALTAMYYSHPDGSIATRWKYFAFALVVGIQVAWYEVITIFPTNDRLVEIEHELRNKNKEEDKKTRGEVLELFEIWRRWHIGRIVVPLISLSALIAGLMY